MDVNVAEVIDARPLGRLQVRIALICAVLIAMDGFDVQAITYVAPLLVEKLGISRALLGPVFSASLIGTTLGGFAFGPVADRLGRRLTLVLCAMLFGLSSLATATSGSVDALIVWRLLAGIGLGGATPTAVALVSEYCPRRSRSAVVMAMYCGFSVGAAAGGFLAAWLIPAYGWEAVFIIGGALPLLTVPLLLAAVPESIRFLLARGRPQPEVAALLDRVAPGAARPGARYVAGEPNPPGFPVAELFTHGRALRTVLAWAMFFLNLIALYFMINWLPTLFHDSGMPVSASVLTAAMIQTGSIVGTLVLALLAQRFAAFSLIGTGFLVGAGCIAALSLVGSSAPLGLSLGFLVGFFVIGTQTGANAVTAMLYPTAIRGTGIGWALGVGRCGSILGPLLGGLLVSWHWAAHDVLLAAAVPSLLAAGCGYALASVQRLHGES